jgi:hypothetical protein
VSSRVSSSLMQVSKGLLSAWCSLVSARPAPFAISSPSADHGVDTRSERMTRMSGPYAASEDGNGPAEHPSRENVLLH